MARITRSLTCEFVRRIKSSVVSGRVIPCADMLGDHVFVNATLGHFDNVLDRHRTRGNRATEPGFDFGAVAGFDLVDLIADDGAGYRASQRTDGRACAGVADLMTRNRAESGAAETADERRRFRRASSLHSRQWRVSRLAIEPLQASDYVNSKQGKQRSKLQVRTSSQ